MLRKLSPGAEEGMGQWGRGDDQALKDNSRLEFLQGSSWWRSNDIKWLGLHQTQTEAEEAQKLKERAMPCTAGMATEPQEKWEKSWNRGGQLVQETSQAPLKDWEFKYGWNVGNSASMKKKNLNNPRNDSHLKWILWDSGNNKCAK